MRAVTVTRPGNAGVLETADRERPTAGPGQVLVRVGAAGVNYMDIYQRAGTAPLPTPFVAGVEGAGEVVAVGQGVTDPAKGDLLDRLDPGVVELLGQRRLALAQARPAASDPAAGPR